MCVGVTRGGVTGTLFSAAAPMMSHIATGLGVLGSSLITVRCTAVWLVGLLVQVKHLRHSLSALTTRTFPVTRKHTPPPTPPQTRYLYGFKYTQSI
ncbi:hypothetical protein E2C01_077726 [Portunus trituberculatus]|uniref:Uncharacterized protein n=1 Tax=Portunus trituberculatus TaxID=210409 RepID=A0A5B7IN30_PORTR|nr:hypothetical protein [Portunus trituberculatus]